MNEDEHINRLLKDGENGNSDNGNGDTQLKSWIFIRRLKLNIKIICEELKNPATELSNIKIKSTINRCIKNNKDIIIPYSDIATILFNATDIERENMSSNMEDIVGSVIRSERSREYINFVIRLNEHIQLSFQQVNFADKFYKRNLKEAKDEVKAENKGMEKEYVAILGIFAAIVLAFTGGLKFSSDAFSSLCSANIYNIIKIAALVGIVIVGMFGSLIGYLNSIIKDNMKEKNEKNNSMIILLIAIVLLGLTLIFLVA